MSDLLRIAAASLLVATAALVPMAASAQAQRFIPDIIISSTIPANGDLNPYGVAFVPPGFPSGGPLAPGDILVSNFNDSGNTQGTGTTIIKLTPNGLVAPAVPAGQPGNAVAFFQGSGSRPDDSSGRASRRVGVGRQRSDFKWRYTDRVAADYRSQR
jgi:hypothetical protein